MLISRRSYRLSTAILADNKQSGTPYLLLAASAAEASPATPEPMTAIEPMRGISLIYDLLNHA